MHSRRSARLVVVAVAAGLMLLSGCQGSTNPNVTGVSQVGPPSSVSSTGTEGITLRMASIDDINVNGQTFGPQAFIDGLDKVSGGLISVQFEESFGDGSATAEAELVKAIAAGELDGGWPATRAFAAAGIPGLEVLEAPMTITSYAAQKDLVSGPVADALLSQLDGSGIVGLELTVGPLRRPFATGEPLLAPQDWQGVNFRVFNSPVQTETVQALGAVPANLGFEWVDEVVAGRLRGAEFDIAQYSTNGLSTEAGLVTADVVLWPKIPVLSLSRQRYEALTDQQQQWVRQAAALAVQKSVDSNYDENVLAQQLCALGVSFLQAGPDNTRALQVVFQPVLDRLAADPETGPLLTEIEAIAANHPAPDGPPPCAAQTTTATS